MPVAEVVELDEDEYLEKVTHLGLLAKSANWSTREAALDALSELNRLLAAGLLKVGPKGYVHGWIKVGPGVAGDVVHHPEHGRGLVSRVGSKTTGVSFDSGKYHAFEHTPRTPEHGAAHFVERTSARKPKVPKPEAAPKLEVGRGASRSFADMAGRHAEATGAKPRAPMAARHAVNEHLEYAAQEIEGNPNHPEERHAADAVRSMMRDVRSGKLHPDDVPARLAEVAQPLRGTDAGSSLLRMRQQLIGVPQVRPKPKNEPSIHTPHVATRTVKPTRAPRAPRKAAAPKPPRMSAEDTVARLRDARSRQEAHALLEGHQKKDLTAALDHAGIAYRKAGTKDELRQALVQRTAGRRLDSETISRPSPSYVRSDKPIQPNTWGDISHAVAPGDVHFHDHGEIGQAIHGMGDDRHLEVEGDALANVLGRVATDGVTGRITSEQQIQRLREIRSQVPPQSAAARSITSAIERLDAPKGEAPKLPDVAPAPLHRLAAALHSIPLARRDTSKELGPLHDIASQFADGKTGGLRLISAVRDLRNRRHESQEGKFEVDRAVDQAVRELEDMKRADRTSLFPPNAR